MVKVLWVSRHKMLGRQLNHIISKFPEVDFLEFRGKVESAESLVEDLVLPEKVDIVIPVLPLSIIARLVELGNKHGFEVWWAEMEQVAVLDHEPREGEYDKYCETYIKGAEGTYKIMRFKQFHRIKKISLELEPV